MTIEEQFRAYLVTYEPFTHRELDIILSTVQIETFHAEQVLLKKGSPIDHLYFLASGYLMFYQPIANGRKVLYFTWPNQLFTEPDGFLNQQSASSSIMALSPGSLLVLSRAALATIYAEVPRWHLLARKVLNDVRHYTQKLLDEQRTQTAEQRYQLLCETEPHLVQQVSVRDMASYLGISPDSLSRIRGKRTA